MPRKIHLVKNIDLFSSDDGLWSNQLSDEERDYRHDCLDVLNFMIENILTDRQRICVRAWLNGENLSDLARTLGIRYSVVVVHRDRAIKRMKKFVRDLR